MSVIKARVINGRYKDEIVRVSNVSTDAAGRRRAACIFSDNRRANIPVADLEVIPEVKEPEIKKAKTASMPFINGSTSSRTMTHTKNMARPRVDKSTPVVDKVTLATCEACGLEYNIEERRGRPGKITQCESCAEEK